MMILEILFLLLLAVLAFCLFMEFISTSNNRYDEWRNKLYVDAINATESERAFYGRNDEALIASLISDSAAEPERVRGVLDAIDCHTIALESLVAPVNEKEPKDSSTNSFDADDFYRRSLEKIGEV